MINLPIIGQRNDNWGSEILGFGTGTIAQYGCTLCCISMALGISPKVVNEKFKEKGVYVGTTKNLIEWTKVEEAYPEAKWNGRIDCQTTPAPLSEIDAMLDKGQPVIIWVEADEIGSPKNQHFVIIVGKKDGDYVINDPWFGDQVLLGSRYTNQGSNKPENVVLGVRKLAIQPNGSGTIETDMDMYLGIDLNNKESVKVAVQTWKEVVDGKYIKADQAVPKGVHETALTALRTANEKIEDLTKKLELAQQAPSPQITNYQDAKKLVIQTEENWRKQA